MKTPTSKTLLGLAIVAFVMGIIVFPTLGPTPIPSTGPDGSVLHRADGSVLFHPAIRRYWADTLPSDILFIGGSVLVIWLVVRHLKVRKSRP